MRKPLRQKEQSSFALSANHSALLTAAKGVGLTANALEKAAALPQAWLTKARKGEREGPDAEVSWGKLGAYLAARGVAVIPLPSSPSALTTEAGRGKPADDEGDENGAMLVAELGALTRDANTYEKLDDVARRTGELMVLGYIDRRKGPMLTSQQKEQRQIIKAIEEQRKAIDSRKPLTVHVVWASDWRKKVETNQAAAAAEAEAADAEAS